MQEDFQKILSSKRFLMGAIIAVCLLISAFYLANVSPYRSNTHLQYFRATVIAVSETKSTIAGNQENIRSKLLDGPSKGSIITVTRSIDFGDASYRRVPLGSEILLTKEPSLNSQYNYSDRWHIPGMATILILLLIVTIIIGMWRGLTSMFGLVISIVVLSGFVLPRIIAGDSAFSTCIEGALIITVIAIFIAHGFKRRTLIAFCGSLLTLAVVVGMVGMTTYLTGTSEVVDENSYGILYSQHPVSLSGLLTGGIIIGSLGVLYDVTTGQAAAVDEMYKANKKLKSMQLYTRGLSVGREHIAALINTLALVYVGVALPSIVITAVYIHAPLIVVLNNETVVEEVVRSVVASVGLILAVPITTGLAAWLLPKLYSKKTEKILKEITSFYK